LSIGKGNQNRRSKSYRDLYDKFNSDTQEIFDDAFRTFEKDPEHPSLANHPLTDGGRGRHRAHSRAVSVTARYRAIYVVDGNTNIWYWCETHEAYNTYTGRK
jgi:mRNA-degrading endonuclease RelE of RelBE toxin-antitoxin system